MRKQSFSGKTVLFVLSLALVMIFAWLPAPALLAAVVVETVNGRAVLDGGVEKARNEAVSAALQEALKRYIFTERGVSRRFEREITENIIKRPNRFILSYGIQNERPLGDLYLVELRVELREEVLDAALEKIEKPRKRIVKELLLAVLPPLTENGEGAVAAALDPEAGAAAPVLEASLLCSALRSELAVYGFDLKRSGPLSSDLKAMLARTLKPAGEWNRDGRKIDPAWFKGLLAGDLVIVIRSGPAREEKVVSLGKSFWKGRAEMAFIDIKNGLLTHLPPVSAKVIEPDYVSGLKTLTRSLTEKVKNACLDRLLRDYVMPEAHETVLTMECRGFRSPADFELLRQRLENLRIVREVSLVGLTAGRLELRIRLLVNAGALLEWLNNFRDPEFAGRLFAYSVDPKAQYVVVAADYAGRPD